MRGNSNRLVKVVLEKPSLSYSIEIAGEWCRIFHNNQQPVVLNVVNLDIHENNARILSVESVITLDTCLIIDINARKRRKNNMEKKETKSTQMKLQLRAKNRETRKIQQKISQRTWSSRKKLTGLNGIIQPIQNGMEKPLVAVRRE